MYHDDTDFQNLKKFDIIFSPYTQAISSSVSIFKFSDILMYMQQIKGK